MLKKTNDYKLRKIQETVREWELMFDEIPANVLRFDVNEYGQLILNDIVLCPLALIDVDVLFYGAEYFTIPLLDNTVLDIEIEWPYRGHPEVVGVCNFQYLYQKEYDD